jgi:hypothetical protein
MASFLFGRRSSSMVGLFVKLLDSNTEIKLGLYSQARYHTADNVLYNQCNRLIDHLWSSINLLRRMS